MGLPACREVGSSSVQQWNDSNSVCTHVYCLPAAQVCSNPLLQLSTACQQPRCVAILFCNYKSVPQPHLCPSVDEGPDLAPACVAGLTCS